MLYGNRANGGGGGAIYINNYKSQYGMSYNNQFEMNNTVVYDNRANREGAVYIYSYNNNRYGNLNFQFEIRP